jgi:Chaperone of endosialidase
MSGGTTTSDQQSQSVTQIPQWMQQAGQQNYAYAQDVASLPLQQYQGQMVADVAPQTQQAWNLAASSGNVGQDQYGASTAGYLNSLGQTVGGVTDPGNAASIRAAQLSKTNLSPYMSPYTQSVINTTLPIYQQQLAQSQNQQQNAANSANAFGGSRQAIQQGVTQAQGAQGMAQMAQQLNQANFTQAQQAAQGDVAARNAIAQSNQANQQANLNRNLTAQTTNQAAQQAKINSDILASQGLTNTGNALNQANLQNYNMLTSSGAGQSMQAQNQINAQMQKFQGAVNYPQQQLATLLSALGMTPHDTSTTGSQQTQTTTPTDWANVLTQGLGAAADVWKVASDKRVKKNITPMGSDPATGIPIKSFQFKGQPKSAPKTIGPLAQDVEKAMPGSTTTMAGGVMAVPRSTIARATPSVAVHPAFAGNKPTPPIMGALAAPSTGLNKFMPPKSAGLGALVKPRAGAKGLHGLANTKRGMASVVGALGG